MTLLCPGSDHPFPCRQFYVPEFSRGAGRRLAFSPLLISTAAWFLCAWGHRQGEPSRDSSLMCVVELCVLRPTAWLWPSLLGGHAVGESVQVGRTDATLPSPCCFSYICLVSATRTGLRMAGQTTRFQKATDLPRVCACTHMHTHTCTCTHTRLKS